MKGQHKDDVAHEQLKRFLASGRREGVLFIGRAQEKAPLFRTEKRHAADGRSYLWIVKGHGDGQITCTSTGTTSARMSIARLFRAG
jgi:hypothetical protein